MSTIQHRTTVCFANLFALFWFHPAPFTQFRDLGVRKVEQISTKLSRSAQICPKSHRVAHICPQLRKVAQFCIDSSQIAQSSTDPFKIAQRRTDSFKIAQSCTDPHWTARKIDALRKAKPGMAKEWRRSGRNWGDSHYNYIRRKIASFLRCFFAYCCTWLLCESNPLSVREANLKAIEMEKNMAMWTNLCPSTVFHQSKTSFRKKACF